MWKKSTDLEASAEFRPFTDQPAEFDAKRLQVFCVATLQAGTIAHKR